jgi:hypothetical protein
VGKEQEMNAQPYEANTPDTELDRLLAQADRKPVVVERNGARYRVIREADDIWADYDPEKAMQAIERSAGILKRAGVDAERLEKDIYADRTQNSTARPAN